MPDEPYSVSGCIGAKCAEPASWEGYDVEQATAALKRMDEIDEIYLMYGEACFGCAHNMFVSCAVDV